MAETKAVQPTDIDNRFARNAAELYANKPFYGSISRMGNTQKIFFDYVGKEDRLTLQKWLDKKDISEGRFLLERPLPNGKLQSFEFMVDKNAESTAMNPFKHHLPAANNENGNQNNSHDPIKDEYEAQNKRLSANLAEADRKNRDLMSEVEKLKRESSSGNTETLISHQKEISELKEAHRDTVDELKEEISDKKHELRMQELERNQGDRSGWNRFFDMLEKNIDGDFIANAIESAQKMAGGQQQATPQQLQAAFQQQAKAQFEQQQRTNPEPAQSQTPDGKRQTAPLRQGSEGQAEQPQQTVQNDQINKQRPNPENSQAPKTTPDQQMATIKNNLSQQLTNAALAVLTDKNANLNKYANEVKSQLALLRQQGVTLDAAQWVQMAKILGERAVEQEITPDRVATVIKPAVEGLPSQYAMMLKMISPKAATDQLFEMFSIQASEPVQNLVTKVFKALKKSI